MKHGHGRYTRGCRCNVCRKAKREYQREYRKRNREKVRADWRAYHRANREKIKQRETTRRNAKRAEIRAAARKHYHKHRKAKLRKEPPAHGLSGYTNYGCRCETCVAAKRAYQKAYYAGRRRNDAA